MNDFEQELHPVIEAFVCDFAEDNLDSTEFTAFSEVLYNNKELEQFALSAREGYNLISLLRKTRVSDDFEEKLFSKIKLLQD